MKFINKSKNPPPLYSDYIAKNPTEEWNTFTSTEPDVVKEIREQLIRDQRGICAYCEIDLTISGNGVGLSDFRIEHFHPKHDNHPEWTYQWNNLLAVCCGGSQRYLCDGADDRFTAPDLSCDAAKGEMILDADIFNPTQDEILLSLNFEYTTSGEMGVNVNCADEARATATIMKLRLSTIAETKRKPAQRLTRLRAGVLDGLMSNLQKLMEDGLEVEDAMIYLAEAMFHEDPLKNWPKFFSCIRWYLGPAAEERLKAINYVG
ncbi:retron system putative HNH endonuclease [Brucella pseudogrignonensis]|uniref:retron system putative HNH endonuclease n=1 Tax=Brucella pseudogrignonensis TaxID=419475 RepID=UPI003D970B40